MFYRRRKLITLVIILLPLAACKTAPRVISAAPISSVPMVEAEPLPKSIGGDMPRAELLDDDLMCRAEYRALSERWNQVVRDFNARMEASGGR